MKLLLTWAAIAIAASLHAQSSLRLAGSTTVKGALEAKQTVLEAAAGAKIEFSGTGTNAGLAAIIAGNADIAMLSTPLEEVARRLNERTPDRINLDDYRATHIGDARIVFIVNPRNPVRSLKADQLADVLRGKIQNWKQVGGADAPILVVSLANAGSLVQEKLLHGDAVTAKARAVPNATQIPVVVAQEPNAIGIISAAHARGQTSLVQTDAEVLAPLFLVTRGEPAGAAQKVIAAAQQLLGGL